MVIWIPLHWRKKKQTSIKNNKTLHHPKLWYFGFGTASTAPHHFKRHSNRQGRSPSPGPDVGAAVCWKMRSAACSPGRMRQSGTTQGPVHQLAYGGPSTIKTEWTAPSLPACLPACHPGACWVTLTTGPSEGSRTPLRGKEGGSMGNEALPCKWNSFWITPSTHTDTLSHTHTQFSTVLVFREGTTACWRKLSGVLRTGRRSFIASIKEKNKSDIWFISEAKAAILLQVSFAICSNIDGIGSSCVILKFSSFHFSIIFIYIHPLLFRMKYL